MSDGLIEKNQSEVMLVGHPVVIRVWYLFHCNHFSVGTVQFVVSNDNLMSTINTTTFVPREEMEQT